MRIALLATDNRENFRRYDQPDPYFGTAPEALIQGFSLLTDLEVHVVSCIQQPIPSPEKLAENIWFHSLHVPKIGWMRTGYQGCIRAVRRKLRQIEPEIVHGQGTERNCAISAVFSGFPNVITIHGNMRLIAKINNAGLFSFQRMAAFLEAITIPRSKGVVCITDYTKQAVGPIAKKTWVIPNAVNRQFFEVTPTPSGVVEILVAGTICVRKNQNAFICALDSLAAQHSLTVHFVGEANQSDPYVLEFNRLVANRPWCKWTGFTDRATMRELFARATMVALPSLEDNCPMVVLEGMAAGCPIIASNVGGVPELIQEGVHGLLFDPLRAQSMAFAVEKILENPAEATRLGQNARHAALERFHPRKIAEQHIGVYGEVLGRL